MFIVTDAALYRFQALAGHVRTIWRETYENIGIPKPGQTQTGSGTTPTLMGRRYVSVTDNSDPMQIVVYKRRRRVEASGGCAASPSSSRARAPPTSR